MASKPARAVPGVGAGGGPRCASKQRLPSALEAAAAANPVVTLTGPRQSGKITLVRALFPHHRCRAGARAASATRASLPHIESSMSLSRSSGSPVSLCIRRTVLFELLATFGVPKDSCGWPIKARTALRRFDQL